MKYLNLFLTCALLFSSSHASAVLLEERNWDGVKIVVVPRSRECETLLVTSSKGKVPAVKKIRAELIEAYFSGSADVEFYRAAIDRAVRSLATEGSD